MLNVLICLMACISPMTSFFLRFQLRHYSRRQSRLFCAERMSSAGLSMDLASVSDHTPVVLSHLKSRGADAAVFDSVQRLGVLRQERSSLISQSNGCKHARNQLSQEIGTLMKSQVENKIEIDKLKEEVSKQSELSAEYDVKLERIDSDVSKTLLQLPNLLDDRVPEGSDDKDNVVVRTWGADQRKVGADFPWHDDIGHSLGELDLEAAVRLSGARFSVLFGGLAHLERALTNYMIDFHVERGYREVSVPFIVSRSTLQGTGQLPKFEEDLFQVNHNVSGENAFLIPTAEVPVTNLYRNQLLAEDAFPIKFVCHSPSFRAEAGSHGRDSKGLLRQHQFHKVELVSLCKPSESDTLHESMVHQVEELMQSLGLPHRTVLLCSGDTGFSAHICYDIEVWLPGQQAYREISSISNCRDFQSRRMGTRYKEAAPHGKKSGKAVFPHTLNGSGVAVGRALIAVLENYYNSSDGSVTIPQVLRPYMNGLTVLSRVSSTKS